jgi:outer membrane lipoprotein-sorting protein
MRFRYLTTLLFSAAWTMSSLAAKDSLDDLKSRMDASADKFQAMTAQVTYTTHTEVLGSDDKETGSVLMKKVKAGDVQGRIDFETPDKKLIFMSNRRVRIVLPKIKTVQVYDLGKQGEKLDQFIMIGFGTSGTQLARDYTMKVLGNETLKGAQNVAVIRLELVPKTDDVKQYVTKLELLIPQVGDTYPIQEKISMPEGNYRLVDYTNIRPNPAIKADALEYKLPPGYKEETVGR